MRALLLSLLCLSFYMTGNAQELQKNYINYQGVAGDASGNPIVNTAVNIQLALKFGNTNATASYIENHAITTDANGVFSLQIGTGTVVIGDYSTLTWGNEAAFITVSLNGAEVGTTELVAVPYAISSGDSQWTSSGNDIQNKNTGKVSVMNDLEIGNTLQLTNGAGVNEFSIDGTLSDNSDNAVPTEKAVKTYVDANATASGLEALDEGNGIGWRLKGRDPNNYGNIGLNAVDLSYTNSNDLPRGALGNRSVAMGYNSIASGNLATALGNRNTASGSVSTAMGNSTIASGNTSTAIGDRTNAIGDNSTAIGTNTHANANKSIAMGEFSSTNGDNSISIGRFTTAYSYGEIAIGRFNTDYTPASTTSWNENDRLFVIGNGDDNIFLPDPNDALIIYKNGNAKFDAKIQHTTTGDANLIPIAYGSVDADGSILGGTGNFTVSFSANEYTITITGETLSSSDTSVAITPNTTTFRSSTATFQSGNLKVHLFASSFAKVGSPFQFVIYKK